MHPKKFPSCEFCRHSAPAPRRGPLVGQAPQLICALNPPQVVAMPLRTGQFAAMSMQPVVDPGECCSHFSKREDDHAG